MGNTPMNTKGAAQYLGCTENWIHKLVASQRIKAHIYDAQGTLIEHAATKKRQGQGLYFYRSDLDKYKKRKPGRPEGAKDQKPRETKTPLKNA